MIIIPLILVLVTLCQISSAFNLPLRGALKARLTSSHVLHMNNKEEDSSSAGAAATPKVLNKFSRTITIPPNQGASQAMLYATGLTPDTMKLPQVRELCFSPSGTM